MPDPPLNGGPSALLGRWLSLKAKALILTSLVLLTIVVGFTLSAHHELQNQFAQQQALLLSARVDALTGVIESTKTSLRGIASVAKSLEGVSDALLAENPALLKRKFTRHYSELALQLGLDEARFYSRDNRLLASFGNPDSSSLQLMPDWVAEANAKETPVTVFSCSRLCRLYVVTPLLVSGQRAGTALFAMPLGEIVSSFYWVTKADIALLMPDENSSGHSSEPQIMEWSARVKALTNSARHFALLRQVASSNKLTTLESGLVERIDKTDYRLDAVPLSRYVDDAKGYWILISDVTESLAGIKTTIRKNLAYGVLGLAVAELLLAMLLWKPLSRLRTTAQTLPLLGQGEFERARDAIAARRSREITLFGDESDILDETAIALSRRLELLELRVTSRTEKLRSQARDIKRDRDFVKRLLDNAQAIMLTQDRNQTILSLNAFGIWILEGPSAGKVHVKETNFIELLGNSSDVKEISWGLQALADGQRTTYQHDATINALDGQERTIAWRHARLENDDGEITVVSVGLDVSEQRDAERKIAWLADHDPLTNLFNRRRFQEELRRAVAEAMRFQQSGGLLYLDLDQFKYINDASGHAVGDSLLKTVALTLKRTIRSTDIVSRLGGDEFAVLLPQTDVEGAIELAAKIQSALTLLQIDTGSQVQRVTASIGIALYPEHGTDGLDLLATADLAMYQAKSGGRDRWQLYSTDSLGREFIRSELEMKTIVAEALRDDRLMFHYQPIFDLRKATVSHVEALLRLTMPDGQLVMPGEFIGVAERTGIIGEIDRFVLKHAASEIEYFINAGIDIHMSVNQSAFAFDDPTFLGSMRQLLMEHPAVAGHIMLEITESAAVTNFIATCDVLRELQELGCLVAIDDFGTGFSSLKYLKQLPVDYIKIDGVFIRDIVDKQDDQILVQAVIDVAHMFGKETIAEYVEREDSFSWLNAHGVDYVQGYHIGRAMPRADTIELLSNHDIVAERLLRSTALARTR